MSRFSQLKAAIEYLRYEGAIEQDEEHYTIDTAPLTIYVFVFARIVVCRDEVITYFASAEDTVALLAAHPNAHRVYDCAVDNAAAYL